MVAVDAVALLVFVAVGVLTHGASGTAFVRDALCILGGWFALALLVRLYARGGAWRLGATWLAGVTAGVLVRAAVVGHLDAVFLGVALAFTALFVLAARALGGLGGMVLVERVRWPSRWKDAGSPDSRSYRGD